MLHNIRMNWTFLTLFGRILPHGVCISLILTSLRDTKQNDQQRLHSSRITWPCTEYSNEVFFRPRQPHLVWRGNSKDIMAIQSANVPKKCPPNFSHASGNPPGGAPEKSDKNLITLSQIIFSDWLHISIINSVTELAKWKGKDKIVYSVNPDQLR